MTAKGKKINRPHYRTMYRASQQEISILKRELKKVTNGKLAENDFTDVIAMLRMVIKTLSREVLMED
jgi:hypothetical protein